MSQLHKVDETAAHSAEYTQQERAHLLAIAHQAIEATLRREDLRIPSPGEHLAEKRAAFTTLHLGGQLRGCIGYVFPVAPLYRTIAETAISAAFEDPRFYPVTSDEAPHLKIEISVLSLLAPIQPENVVVGRHGLVVTHGAHRGLLLPQVPVEQGWDRETFLGETCRKAGLPVDAWKRGATFEAFTAEVFGE